MSRYVPNPSHFPDMNVVVEPLPNCLTTLRVEVEPEKVTEARESVTREFTKSARIPGYRAGKAPRMVIERKFKRQIREELERKLLGESTRRAISEKGLKVLQLANIEDVKIADDNSLSFTATVVTHPEFVLPQYKAINIEEKSFEVTDEDIEKSIEELREQAADFVSLEEDRGAEMEDFIVVDYTGTIDGKPVHELFPKGGTPLSGNEDFWIKMTEESFFPGFCDALLGARPGDKRQFTIEVPSDFPVEGMPGQKIDYSVEVKSIMKKVLPELNDAFADSVAKGKTLAELRQLGREELERQRAGRVEGEKRNQIMRHLLSWVECELPTNLVRQETQRILSDIVKENQARGVTDEVLRESEKQLVGTAAHSARERIKGTFILMRIAEQEGIKVTKEELLGKVGMLAQRYNMGFDKMLKELEKRNGLDQISEDIMTDKVLAFLVANANVVAAAPPAAPALEGGAPEETVQS
jgi:trigger factor